MADGTDEEQIDAIKRWWSDNGTSLIVGVVLALVSVFGYQTWQKSMRETGEAAATIYDDMLAAIVLDDPFGSIDEQQLSTGRFLANRLKTEYEGTTYAQFAGLFLARLAIDLGDYATAAQELQWVLDHDVADELYVITTSRLARVKIAQGDAQGALDLLAKVEPGEHKPTVEEVKGDAYLAMGDNDAAREAYLSAIDSMGDDEVRPMLQMKLQDLVSPSVVVPNEPVSAQGGQ